MTTSARHELAHQAADLSLRLLRFARQLAEESAKASLPVSAPALTGRAGAADISCGVRRPRRLRRAA